MKIKAEPGAGSLTPDQQRRIEEKREAAKRRKIAHSPPAMTDTTTAPPSSAEVPVGSQTARSALHPPPHLDSAPAPPTTTVTKVSPAESSKSIELVDQTPVALMGAMSSSVPVSDIDIDTAMQDFQDVLNGDEIISDSQPFEGTQNRSAGAKPDLPPSDVAGGAFTTQANITSSSSASRTIAVQVSTPVSVGIQTAAESPRISYCFHCGVRLLLARQAFCHACGSSLTILPDH